MSRSARIHYPGGVFHIISRCLNRSYLLDGTAERAKYLALLEGVARHNDARVLAWCIMSNHVHLVVRAGEEPLSRLMRRVNTGYARWKNNKDARLGPVFAERYKAILVEREAYLLELVRYVHLNPVRAGLVAHPDDTDWTSHPCYSGRKKSPGWLDAGFVLDDFGSDPGARAQAYQRFINDGLEASERSPLLSGDQWADVAREAWARSGTDLAISDPILGSDDWTGRVLEHLEHGGSPVGDESLSPRRSRKTRPNLDALVDLACDVVGVERSVFDLSPKKRRAQTARQLLVRVWVEDYGRTQLELARLLGAAPARVSQWRSRAVERLPKLHDLLEALRARLDVLDAPTRLASGQHIVPDKEPVRSTYRVDVLGERSKIVTPPDESA